MRKRCGGSEVAAPINSGGRAEPFGGGTRVADAQHMENITGLCDRVATGDRESSDDSGGVLFMLQGLRSTRNRGDLAGGGE